MSPSIERVAIIGGGLAGIAMAIALHDMSIPCTVYEARSTHSASKTSSGALMLSPNGLRILERFGVYPQIKEKSFAFDNVYYKNSDEHTIDSYPLGDEAVYGYKALRIYRQELLDILYEACTVRGIQIEFNQKFVKVVSESETEIAFELGDGSVEKASLLIGADGIHSKIRDYVVPGVQKRFLGMAALTWETPTSQLRIPEDKDYKFPVSVVTENGTFVLAPQRRDGSAMLSGTQFSFPDHSREGWDRVMADKQGLIDRVRQNMDIWPDIVKSAMENVNPESLNIWAFYTIPALPSWTSTKHRRVVILGDAAHAIPPTTGNGASQAFEDVFSLSLLLDVLKKGADINWEEALKFWQKMRQDRINKLLELTKQLNNKRLPLTVQVSLPKGEIWFDESEEQPGQMAWLYVPNIEAQVSEWLTSHKATNC